MKKVDENKIEVLDGGYFKYENEGDVLPGTGVPTLKQGQQYIFEK